jgi:predicted ribosomally synthesized peptide with nif11-like leader
MSQAHIEQFYSKAVKDPALINKMLAGTNGPDDFVRNAVKEGKSNGFDFSYDEANAWIKEQQRLKASGELSDSQLEAVAGGKGVSSAVNTVVGGVNTANNAVNSGINTAVNWGTGAVNTVTSGVTSAANSVAHFFSSW